MNLNCLVTYAASFILLATATARAVNMEMVFVGNPGNAPDLRHDPTGFGDVDYGYWIGKYEVTNGQYRAFLNAKATIEDPYGLYNEEMTTDFGGIARGGSGLEEDPWIYYAKGHDASWDPRPVNFVSIWDCMRFINWLHNGQGDGDTESGAYSGIGDEATFVREPGARYVLPTENEWYKAAYYDPNKLGEPGYWEYPTRSDTRPSNDLPPGGDMVSGSANFGSSQLTPVGAYTAKPSTSAYGTFDQGGNLWEWNESFVHDTFFGLRGGSFDNIFGVEASHQDSYPAFFENRIMGFRVAGSVPEPPTAALMTLAVVTIVLLRKRSKKAQA